jgi:hypothetical protein
MPNYFRSKYNTGSRISGDVQANEVLEGKTFSSDNGVNLIGTMPNIGSVSRELLPGGSFIIPEGYHNGSGIISGKENTEIFVPNTRSTSIDMGETNTYRYVNTSGIPNSNTGTFTANSRNASLDMGETNTYRYVNTNNVPNSNTSTYTFSSGNGDTVDLGVANTYRYVNAGNVYNKGRSDGIASYIRYRYVFSAKNYPHWFGVIYDFKTGERATASSDTNGVRVSLSSGLSRNTDGQYTQAVNSMRPFFSIYTVNVLNDAAQGIGSPDALFNTTDILTYDNPYRYIIVFTNYPEDRSRMVDTYTHEMVTGTRNISGFGVSVSLATNGTVTFSKNVNAYEPLGDVKCTNYAILNGWTSGAIFFNII